MRSEAGHVGAGGAGAIDPTDRLNPIVALEVVRRAKRQIRIGAASIVGVLVALVYVVAVVNFVESMVPILSRLGGAAIFGHILIVGGAMAVAGSMGNRMLERLNQDPDGLMVAALGEGRFIGGYLQLALRVLVRFVPLLVLNSIVLKVTIESDTRAFVPAMVLAMIAAVVLTVQLLLWPCIRSKSVGSFVFMLPGMVGLSVLAMIALGLPLAIVYGDDWEEMIPKSGVALLVAIGFNLILWCMVKHDVRRRAFGEVSVPAPAVGGTARGVVGGAREGEALEGERTAGLRENRTGGLNLCDLGDGLNPILALRTVQRSRQWQPLAYLSVFVAVCAGNFFGYLYGLFPADFYSSNGEDRFTRIHFYYVVACAYVLPFVYSRLIRQWREEDPERLLLAALGSKRYVAGHMAAGVCIPVIVYSTFPVFAVLAVVGERLAAGPVGMLTLVTLPFIVLNGVLIVTMSCMPDKSIRTLVAWIIGVIAMLAVSAAAVEWPAAILKGWWAAREWMIYAAVVCVGAVLALLEFWVVVWLCRARKPDRSDAWRIGHALARLIMRRPAVGRGGAD